MVVKLETTEQGTLAGGSARVPTRHVFSVPFGDVRALLEASDVRCWTCDRVGLVCDSPAGLMAVEVYDSPWDKEPKIIHAHRRNRTGMQYYESCIDATSSPDLTDFHYEFCEGCNREIIVRCPSNGWHEYFRHDEDGAVCLRCYERDIFENGLPREKFEAGSIPGMFCDPAELREHGFALVEAHADVFIGGTDAAGDFCAVARAAIDAGQIVAVDYERMAIGGLEGIVSLWTKEVAS